MPRRPALTIGLVAALLAVGCHDSHQQVDTEPVGWHAVSAPPEVLPWGGTLWVADELAFFSVIGGTSWAYVPSRDQWKPISSPPTTDSPAGWTMVSTGTQIVAVSQSATTVYEPKADRWRSLPAAPQPKEFIEPQKWTPSLVWTGREVALQQPFTDEFAAFDVDRGRWRLLPSTGGGRDMTGPLMATASGLVRTVGSLDGVTSVYLLRPGAGSGVDYPTFRPNFIARSPPGASSSRAGSWRDRTTTTAVDTSCRKGGGSRCRPPRCGRPVARRSPTGVWSHSGTGAPPSAPSDPTGPCSDQRPTCGRPSPRLLSVSTAGCSCPEGRTSSWSCRNPTPLTPDWQAAFTPGSTPQPDRQTLPTHPGAGVCQASSVTATAGNNEFTHGERYTVVLTNPTTEVCSLGGPIELTATNGADPPTTFVEERSAQTGPTILALPDVDWAAKVTLNVHSGVPGSGPPRSLPDVRPARRPPISSSRGLDRKADSKSWVRHLGGLVSATWRSLRSSTRGPSGDRNVAPRSPPLGARVHPTGSE